MRFRILILLIFPCVLFGQSPERFSFQAVVYDNENKVVSNKNVRVRISILTGSINGAIEYQEVHSVTTNNNGLFSLEIGNGTPSQGTFGNIQWGSAPHFLKREIDPTGGNNYLISGISQLLSVPYSIFSSVSDTALNVPDTSPTNELQMLSISNDTIYLTNGGFVKIPGINEGDILDGTEEGELLYWNGINWVALSKGLPGQQLIIDEKGIPKWTGDAYPSVTTVSTSSITATTAIISVNITSSGGQNVSSRGVVYATSDHPTLANLSKLSGSGTGSFTLTITDLSPNTPYFVRGFGTNSVGTGYGASISFTTIAPTIPILSTNSITSITQTSAISGGVISSNGGSDITARGVVWSTSPNPTISNSKTTDGAGTGNFSSSLSGLSDNTTYYIRAYATNSVGTAYGNEINFTTTAATVPILTTNAVVNITNTSASSGGAISSDGGSSISAKGIVWSTSSNPTISDNKTIDGTGSSSFNSILTGLSANTTYYVRAYATNGTGTGYGNQVSFTTASTANTLAQVITKNTFDLTTINASVLSEIVSEGGSPTTERGIVWSSTANPTVLSNKIISGSGIGEYNISITSGLSGGSSYYVRAYAVNSYGIAYGNQLSFQTLLGLATLTTNEIIAQSTTASSGGNISDDGGSSISSRGVVWSTSPSPTISDSKTIDGTGKGNYLSNLTNLNFNTTYYIRSYATNNSGTAYGNEKSFTTAALTLPVTDIDGNTYNTVQIGNQIWMSENLKTTRYSNGDEIPYVLDNTTWRNLTTDAWCYYNHDDSYNPSYGKLYNWYVASDGRNVCPSGWHVPTNNEMITLSNYLGGDNVAGGKLKSTGTTFWNSPNEGATNESGFNGLPGGMRTYGSFNYTKSDGSFWTRETNGNYPIGRNLNNYTKGFYSYYEIFFGASFQKSDGLSIRCIKD